MISHHIYLSVAMAHKESQIEAARSAGRERAGQRNDEQDNGQPGR
jgi:hypothetical protein